MPSPAPGAAAASTTDGSAFEGLYQRALKPEGQFEADLRAAGYDVRAPEGKYPSEVWEKCLQIAVRHKYPTLQLADGLRRLGAVFVEGFFQTIFGSFIAVGLPLVGPAMVLRQLPRYFHAMRSGSVVEAVELGPTSYRVSLRRVENQPHFMAGLLEKGLERTGKKLLVQVEQTVVDGFDLLVSWQ